MKRAIIRVGSFCHGSRRRRYRCCCAAVAEPATITNWRSDSAHVNITVVGGQHQNQVTDDHADGRSAVGVYKIGGDVPTTPWTQVWNDGGAGTTVTRDLSLSAGAQMTLSACLGESGTQQLLRDSCRDRRAVYPAASAVAAGQDQPATVLTSDVSTR
jgi:hypothetical protein